MKVSLVSSPIASASPMAAPRLAFIPRRWARASSQNKAAAAVNIRLSLLTPPAMNAAWGWNATASAAALAAQRGSRRDSLTKPKTNITVSPNSSAESIRIASR